jgi:hypothetical protein
MRLPLQYFGEPAMMSAGEGSDRMGVSGLVVRPKIGGKRSMRKRNTCKKGGFYPSVMGNFVPRYTPCPVCRLQVDEAAD